ncbi:protoporphyrinogen oxidase [Bacteroides pyogenes]|uniref:protoporphyrinogen oxidase n=1 Tax=Bacteroides pyogenes TaxID=310300 RepID=UPI001F1F54F1|nr:protoporphyrinogen oxidase [Bacteroides pyogenes]MCE9107814.1 protoporphyrinogen oxidase [Bacteroides pyogenes]
MNDIHTSSIRRREIVVIGAGLTGLTVAYELARKNKDVEVLEQQDRIGGQIRTYTENGFTFESGPNTGVISCPEVAELFESLSPECRLETACEDSKRRLIWKKGKFRPLPSGLFSAICTPLFTFKDKLRILGEPFRPKGTDPDEPVGLLARRRLGNSFLHYAVDPFLSGVYAGDPMRLVTRYALPKLYNLEQNHGSFIRGAIAKAKVPKTERDKLATKKVFSARGGFGHLVQALGRAIGNDRITLSVKGVTVEPAAQGWRVSFLSAAGEKQCIDCEKVVTTVGAYALPQILPFVEKEDMDKIAALHYAPIMQIAVGLHDTGGKKHSAFGGLVPSCEKKDVLGILFPSSCFDGRAPEGGMLFSYFVGGVRHPEYLDKTDEEIEQMVRETLHSMLGYPEDVRPDLVRIFRHRRAIPQYDVGSGARFETIDKLQRAYPGLVLAGNIKGGIGMADRIRQAVGVAPGLS